MQAGLEKVEKNESQWQSLDFWTHSVEFLVMVLSFQILQCSNWVVYSEFFDERPLHVLFIIFLISCLLVCHLTLQHQRCSSTPWEPETPEWCFLVKCLPNPVGELDTLWTNCCTNTKKGSCKTFWLRMLKQWAFHCSRCCTSQWFLIVSSHSKTNMMQTKKLSGEQAKSTILSKKMKNNSLSQTASLQG